jgi:hypothetical protein
MHPWHPHPHFSHDGKYIIYNDFEHGGAGTPSRTVLINLPLDRSQTSIALVRCSDRPRRVEGGETLLAPEPGRLFEPSCG